MNEDKIYVDVSRAKKSVKIFTDDKEALAKQAKRFQQKITSATFVKKEKKEEKSQEHAKETKGKTL